ncbi:DMT family transporter [Brachyspira pilosicoli]|uniref:DMT family transporter n=1 Tax=Brachyspira pilosicoli TaxID=52584 RepID=UPI0012F479F6|nr:DMT family transporter [Brachyspira pilosicoli]
MIDKNNKEKLGSIGLFLTALIWGYSFVAVKVVVNELAPFYLVGFRNFIGGIFLFLIFFKITKTITKRDILLTLPIGITLFFGFWLQTISAQFITASKIAFFTGAYVILVPFFTWIVYKKKPHAAAFITALITLIGLYLLTSVDGIKNIKVGDLFAILCAVAFAIHLVLIDAVISKVNGIKMASLQLLIAGSISLILGFITRTPLNISALSNETIYSFLYLAIGATAMAYLLQTVSQKYVSPHKTGIILSLESFLGALCGIIFMQDAINLKTILGGLFIISAIFICEIGSNIKKS